MAKRTVGVSTTVIEDVLEILDAVRMGNAPDQSKMMAAYAALKDDLAEKGKPE